MLAVTTTEGKYACLLAACFDSVVAQGMQKHIAGSDEHRLANFEQKLPQTLQPAVVAAASTSTSTNLASMLLLCSFNQMSSPPGWWLAAWSQALPDMSPDAVLPGHGLVRPHYTLGTARGSQPAVDELDSQYHCQSFAACDHLLQLELQNLVTVAHAETHCHKLLSAHAQ